MACLLKIPTKQLLKLIKLCPNSLENRWHRRYIKRRQKMDQYSARWWFQFYLQYVQQTLFYIRCKDVWDIYFNCKYFMLPVSFIRPKSLCVEVTMLHVPLNLMHIIKSYDENNLHLISFSFYLICNYRMLPRKKWIWIVITREPFITLYTPW